MRCHYEVLGLPLTATNDEIKKAHRKCALQWHPDKHADNKEEANKRFLEIQDAYETLMDVQERAWYDSHREIIINGGTPGEPGQANYTFNVYPYFSPTCFRGFEDDEKGFYTIYREMFTKIAEEDRPYYDEGVKIPEFGDSTSDYDTIVGPFYSFWMSYCSPRSFVWTEKYDTREATDRNVRRAMEKENKKFRDKAKKERNEEIRQVVTIVRKKDKRVEQYKKLLEEKALLNQKKSQEKQEADRQRRIDQMKAYVEPAWSAVEKKLEELDLEEENERTNKFKSQSAAASASANNNDDNDDNNNEENLNDTNLDENDDYDDDFDESLFCVACNKAFKNEKSFLNHEKSKKHRDNIDLLKKHMKEEDKKVLFGAQCENDEMKNEETKQQQQEVNKSKLSKKQKKKRKQNKNNLNNSSSDDGNEEKINEEEEEDSKIKDNNESLVTSSDQVNIEPLNNQNPIEPVELNLTSNVETENQNQAKKSICGICNKEFESRSKLFNHIKEEGHAAPKLPVNEQPLSHNSVKRNKRLANKTKK